MHLVIILCGGHSNEDNLLIDMRSMAKMTHHIQLVTIQHCEILAKEHQSFYFCTDTT